MSSLDNVNTSDGGGGGDWNKPIISGEFGGELGTCNISEVPVVMLFKKRPISRVDYSYKKFKQA